MKKHVLLTRPLDDSRALADALEKRGHRVTVAPMLSIHIRKAAAQELETALAARPQALIASSANGIRALAKFTPRRGMKLFVVGEASAETAAGKGFARVTPSAGPGGGNAATLIAAVARQCKPEYGPLLYLTGGEVAGNVEAALAASGFALRRVTLYDAIPARGFPPEALDRLRQGEVHAALFYSRRTAETFMNLARAACIEDRLASAAALCLSPPIVEKLGAPPWRAVRAAARPVTAAMLDLLEVP